MVTPNITRKAQIPGFKKPTMMAVLILTGIYTILY